MPDLPPDYDADVDYKLRISNHSSHVMKRFIPNAGGDDLPWTAAAGTEIIFDINAGCYNLFRSYFKAKIAYAAGGGGLFIWAHSGTLAFLERVQFYDDALVYPVDVAKVAKVYKMLWMNEPVEKWNNAPRMKNATLAAGAGTGGFFTNAGYTDTAANAASVIRPDNTAIVSRLEKQSVCPPSAANAILTLNLRLPLSLFKHTLFAIDKNTFFKKIMHLRFELAPVTQTAWTSTSGVDPTAGGAVALANAATLAQIELWVAYEANPSITKALQAKVESPAGLTILMPYITALQKALAGTAQSWQVMINRPRYGEALMRIYYSVFDAVEATNTSLDNSNVAVGGPPVVAIKVAEYFVEVDGVRQGQAGSIKTATNDDFRLLQNLIEGTMAGLDANIFAFNWCHIVSWAKHPDSGNEVQGVPIDHEIAFNFDATTIAGNWLHLFVAVCQRRYNITGEDTTVI